MKDILADSLRSSKEYQGILASIESEYDGNVLINGLLEGQKNHLLYTLSKDLDRSILYITASDLDAKKIYEQLQLFLKKNVSYLSSEEILFYQLEAKDRRAEALRLQTLLRMIGSRKQIIVASVSTISRKLIPPKRFKECIKRFKVSQVIEPDELINDLVRLGYERVSRVEGYGQFSVRGGIIDIFSLNDSDPVRIEFFGDEIDSIRSFEVFSQKSLKNRKTAEITPSRAFIYPENMEDAIKKIAAECNRGTDDLVLSRLDMIRDGIYFDGIENYMDYFYEEEASIFDYLDDGSPIIIGDITRFRERYKNIEQIFKDNYKTNLERGLALKGQGNLIHRAESIPYLARNHRILVNSLLAKPVNNYGIDKIFNFSSRDIPQYNGKIEILAEDLKRMAYRGFKTVIALPSFARAKKLSEILNGMNITHVLSENTDIEIKSSQIALICAPMRNGFQYNDEKVSFITENEIFGVKKAGIKSKAQKKKPKKNKLDTFMDLNPGDYVVHETNGIGRYTGIEQISVNSVKRDYMKIIYRGGDSLYVPIDQMDKVQKYIGSNVEKVRLSKLGSQEWQKAKTKVRREIEDMTQELIELYAKREKLKGYSFSKDTVWQEEFESKFQFTETDDQLKAIKETKKDMESSSVMDRLICGDVGYGKTEVAIRAVFKACMDSKQSAVLVPTTILAQQHYNTFKERFKDYPVRIEVMSRFRTAKEQKSIAADIKKGLVDVVIGTHRIVSKDVEFKNLGLVVIDEEQRFGVKDKEALKKYRSTVDVLTLSATPIPRTLHMSLSGIRDMSVLEEPPQERYPVMTYVVEARESIIKDEIEREIDRGGQVFFVYNRVEHIDEIASRLRRLIPDARIAVAHGKMSSKNLENTIFAFLDKEYDVLVCTTIIETGLDIANANTMIVYDADKMGLAQLYQLRGRVGRSTRQGYAFLMYEKDKVLSEIAEKRLKAIKEFTEFGSGFKIAMRDLEIRGAGNILGAQQHGHMAAVGYDLYIKMLNTAINRIQGIKEPEEVDTEIDLDVDAYIPDFYISDEMAKIEMYKKIASIDSREDVMEVTDELVDRFSDIPKVTETLIEIAYIKSLCRRLKIEKISQNGDIINLVPSTRLYFKNASGYNLVIELRDKLETIINSPMA